MEPMDLGSPGNSPSSNQSQYLPPLLMGDPQALNPRQNTLAPRPDRYSPYEFNRSTLNSRAGGLGHNASNSVAPSHTHHQQGPPIVGLFDSLGEPIFEPRGNHSSMLQSLQEGPPTVGLFDSLGEPIFEPQGNHPPNQGYQSYQSSYHTNDSYPPMRAMCSPVGPTTLSLVSRSSTANVDNPGPVDFWVTIFGFPPGNITMVLQHFTHCGNIVDVVRGPQNGNWMHVRFSSPIASNKALNYNHKVIDGNVMVGVTRCTDPSAIIDTEKRIAMANPNMASPAHQQMNKLAENNNDEAPDEAPDEDEPQIPWLVNKAMDFLFGK